LGAKLEELSEWVARELEKIAELLLKRLVVVLAEALCTGIAELEHNGVGVEGMHCPAGVGSGLAGNMGCAKEADVKGACAYILEGVRRLRCWLESSRCGWSA
jgi:hypothetical protein